MSMAGDATRWPARPASDPFDVFLAQWGGALLHEVDALAAAWQLDADDLRQEVHVRLYAKYHTLPSDAAAYRYGQTIAENLAKRLARTRARRAEQPWCQAAEEQMPPEMDPAVIIEQRELATRVRRAVSALPRPQRQVAELSYFHDLPRAHVAARTGLSESSVKGHLSRAATRLRRHLDDARALLPLGVVRLRWRRHAAATLVPPTVWTVAAVCCLVFVQTPVLRSVPPGDATTYRELSGPPVSRSVAPPHPAPTSRPRGDALLAPLSWPTPRRHKPPRHLLPSPPTSRVCVVGTCVGRITPGDEICLTATDPNKPVACTRENSVPVCEAVPAGQPVVTCHRHGDPEWMVSPPPVRR